MFVPPDSSGLGRVHSRNQILRPGPQPLAHPVDENVRNAVRHGAGLYVGGRFIAPASVTGWYRSDDVFTFERMGAPDVVSDPEDDADCGALLYDALTALHAGALRDPWTTNIKVTVPELLPSVYDVQLHIMAARHESLVGMARVRFIKNDGSVVYAGAQQGGDGAGEVPFSVGGLTYRSDPQCFTDSDTLGTGFDLNQYPLPLRVDGLGTVFQNGAGGSVIKAIEFDMPRQYGPTSFRIDASADYATRLDFRTIASVQLAPSDLDFLADQALSDLLTYRVNLDA